MSAGPPRLTFFCELDAQALLALFARDDVVPTLQRMGAAVSLGLIDLSDARADVVRRLNAAGVPVTAWLLLPVEDGYFQHVGNAAASEARLDALIEWSAREELVWAGVGLDVEQDRAELEGYLRAPWRFLTFAARRASDRERLRRALDGHEALIARIRARWPVETYQFPALADDRAAGSELLQRAFGMMDLAVDREVWMLYSSLFGAGVLASYGPEAQAIGVGSTGGGIDPMPRLGWDRLRRDLLLARRWTDAIYVFSLEGCVGQDMLGRVEALDWDAPIEGPRLAKAVVDGARRALGAGLRGWARFERRRGT